MAQDPNAKRDKALESIAKDLHALVRINESISYSLMHIKNALDRAYPLETDGTNAAE